MGDVVLNAVVIIGDDGDLVFEQFGLKDGIVWYELFRNIQVVD